MAVRQCEARAGAVAREAIEKQAGAEVDRPQRAGVVAHQIWIAEGAVDVLEERVDGREPVEKRLRQSWELAGSQVGGVFDELQAEIGARAAAQRIEELIGAG